MPARGTIFTVECCHLTLNSGTYTYCGVIVDGEAWPMLPPNHEVGNLIIIVETWGWCSENVHHHTQGNVTQICDFSYDDE